VRVIYYWAVHQDRILLLLDVKNEQDDLTVEQLSVAKN
jgi:hypothetical protein